MSLELDVPRLKRFWNRYRKEARFLLTFDPPVEIDRDFLLDRSSSTTSGAGGGSGGVRATQWLMTPRGWSGVVTGGERFEDALAWLTWFAEGFAALEGTITGGPTSPGTGLGTMSPSPTAFVAYATGNLAAVPSDDRDALWHVEDNLTRHILEKAQEWAWTPDCRQVLARHNGWTVELSGLDWEQPVTEAVNRYGYSEIGFLQRKPLRLRKMELSSHGQVSYQVNDVTRSWQERTEMARRTLVWTPPQTNLGFIRTDAGNAVGWNMYYDTWPHVNEPAVRDTMPLLASMVPDVNGIQLLTDAHLYRAHDLSAWTVTDLPGGRHMVEAADLEPWYGSAFPDPDVRAQAREDFGDMIMTPELLAAEFPWPDRTPKPESWRSQGPFDPNLFKVSDDAPWS